MIRSGLIGRAIQASRSPLLHEREARAQGLALRYDLFDLTARGLPDAALGDVLAELRAGGYAGVNVTYPFKQQVMPLLDEIAEGAAQVGAVNTIVIRDGRLTGHNTDMQGFQDSVADGLADTPRRRVWQLGAGGAGAATATALLRLGVERLLLSDVDPARADALAARLGERFGAGRAVALDYAAAAREPLDGLVNATPMGMAANPASPFPADALRPERWVADIVYFPLETELLRQARAHGCRTLDGSGMVVAQAARAFALITGHTADRARMHEIFLAS